MKPIFYPYKIGSQSAKVLSRALKGKRVFPDRNYVPKRRHVIINWGNSTMPTWWDRAIERNCLILNHPDSVRLASNKIETFEKLTEFEVETLDYTTDRNVAQEWVDNEKWVIVRHKISGSGGDGIELIKEGEVPQARLYTKYKRKQKEFRLHVFGEVVIDYAQKKRRENWEEIESFNKYVRNYENGWVFCRDDISLPEGCEEIAIDTLRALDLDFGAVDLGVKRNGEVFVIEVNSAPGVEGTTLDKYKEFIGDLCAA